MPWYWTDDINDALAALGLTTTKDPAPDEATLAAIRRPEASIKELIAALEDEDEPPLAA